jgi:hypothetical protein
MLSIEWLLQLMILLLCPAATEKLWQCVFIISIRLMLLLNNTSPILLMYQHVIERVCLLA